MPSNYSSTELLNEGCAPVGIESLDKELRGIKKGSIVAIIGDPMSQAPLFLRHLPATGPTDYFSTYQPENIIKKKLLQVETVPEENINIHELYNREEGSVSIEVLLESLNDTAESEETTHNTIIDSITSIRNLENHYAELIRTLQQTAPDKDGLTYIYFARDGVDDLTPEEKEILHASDSVIQLQTEVRGDNIYHEFILKKSLGRTVPTDTIRLDYGKTITINTATSH